MYICGRTAFALLPFNYTVGTEQNLAEATLDPHLLENIAVDLSYFRHVSAIYYATSYLVLIIITL